MNDYQDKAKKTCTGRSYSYAYLGDGIDAELGEFKDKIAKMVRKGELPIHFSREDILNLPDDKRQGLMLELGDVLWFVALLADWFGWSMNEVATANICKLLDRSARNVIIGDGDYR